MGRVRSRGGAIAAVVAAVAAMSMEAGAAGSGDIPRKATFRVTVSGTISTAVNTYPDESARCRPTTEVGVWRLLTFRSSRATRVTVMGGSGPIDRVRFVRPRLRRLSGAIHIAAPSQYELLCRDGSHTTVRADYFTGSTSWRGGAVRLTSPARGRILLGPLRGVPADPGGACGRASGAPLGLGLAPGRFVQRQLFDESVKKLVIRGRRSRSAHPSPTCGVSESVDWQLNFRRVA